MKFVYICSKLRGDIERNIRKANGYCRFAMTQCVLPLAPHCIFTQFLDDELPEERNTGILLGLWLMNRCDELWVFGKSISEGMQKEIEHAEKLRIPIRHFTDMCEEMKQ